MGQNPCTQTAPKVIAGQWIVIPVNMVMIGVTMVISILKWSSVTWKSPICEWNLYHDFGCYLVDRSWNHYNLQSTSGNRNWLNSISRTNHQIVVKRPKPMITQGSKSQVDTPLVHGTFVGCWMGRTIQPKVYVTIQVTIADRKAPCRLEGKRWSSRYQRSK